MKNTILVIAILTLSVIFSSNSQAGYIELNFDDITTLPYVTPVPSGYGGLELNWTNIGVVQEGYAGGWYPKAAVSGNYAAYNDDGLAGTTISSTSKNFNFYGAYFTTANKPAGIDGDIKVEAFLNGTQVGSTVTIDLLSQADPVWVDFDFENIDTLVFTPLRTGNAAYFAMDNVRIEMVPLPATILLGFLGLGVGGWRLRRKME